MRGCNGQSLSKVCEPYHSLPETLHPRDLHQRGPIVSKFARKAQVNVVVCLDRKSHGAGVEA